jgi:hypothetical protein
MHEYADMVERERDEALADAEELGAAYDLAVREMDKMWTERDAALKEVGRLLCALTPVKGEA